jgi:predicted nucleotidyltransferase
MRKAFRTDQKPTIASIRERALPILTHYGATRAGIFGSLARGEDTSESDVDVLVELGKDLSLSTFQIYASWRVNEAVSRNG